MRAPSTASRDAFAARFNAFVANRSFPCVGAKSALNRGRLQFGLYDRLADGGDAASLCDQLGEFSRRHPDPGEEPVSFVAMFREPVANEQDFHGKLWRHLQAMHDIDSVDHPWDPAVSDDATDEAFSFSVHARAFFVVGLHPQASRLARQAPFPCLVFNFHEQFEAMRASGKYQKLQQAIRSRDVALQGYINPVLARFGEASEAHQYSGLATGAEARCPFRSRNA